MLRLPCFELVRRPHVVAHQCCDGDDLLCSALVSSSIVHSQRSPPAHHYVRCLHSASPALAEITIEVPSMGDSITEGSVASVEKKEGTRTLRLYFSVHYESVASLHLSSAVLPVHVGANLESMSREHARDHAHALMPQST
jgi:hypothetical protein